MVRTHVVLNVLHTHSAVPSGTQYVRVRVSPGADVADAWYKRVAHRAWRDRNGLGHELVSHTVVCHSR